LRLLGIGNFDFEQRRELLELRPDGVEGLEEIDSVAVDVGKGFDDAFQLRNQVSDFLVDWRWDLGVLEDGEVEAKFSSDFCAAVETCNGKKVSSCSTNFTRYEPM
jgi:hypothetical protein